MCCLSLSDDVIPPKLQLVTGWTAHTTAGRVERDTWEKSGRRRGLAGGREGGRAGRNGVCIMKEKIWVQKIRSRWK